MTITLSGVNDPPETSELIDFIVDDQGRKLYTEKETKARGISFHDGVAQLAFPDNLASALSSVDSFSSNKGFLLRLSYSDHTVYEYYFAVKVIQKSGWIKK